MGKSERTYFHPDQPREVPLDEALALYARHHFAQIAWLQKSS